ncbi:MAG: HAMP domain-containing histidine kinase [Myxococcales bacterium]|nr:HAMP domain-containing histidine kinase [Myxococcales bacterium]
MRGVRHYVRSRLHRRLFLWFGASIFVTGLVVAAAAHLLLGGADGGWRRTVERGRSFIGNQLAESWDDPARRDALARSVVRDLGMSIVLEDARGELIGAYGEPCPRPDVEAPVRRQERLLGNAKLCFAKRERRAGLPFFMLLGLAALSLWGASGMIARRLVRPLGELVRVADEIGRGNLGARVVLRRNKVGEIGDLADAINEMASRIERQMADQRELLAGVSHEIRSPLARLRVLSELAREQQGKVGEDIEREVLEIDSLVGQLLASSRLDFGALERRDLDARELAERCLERAGLSAGVLDFRAEETALSGDPTLLARALTNLLENAKEHAGGVERLVVEREAGAWVFAVEDGGPGFAEQDLVRAFDKFVRGEKSAGSSLGLGLSLVRRIAEAHGGRAWAENRSAGGARVAFSVPLRASASLG